MLVVCKKSRDLPVLNSFFVTDPDTIFDLIISTASSTHYRYNRKEKVYEVDKVVMKQYFDKTHEDVDKVIQDQRVCLPDKPQLEDKSDDYEYQKIAGQYMSSQKNCLLFFDTGTGKTRTTINALNMLNPKKTLIILGKSALASVWNKELVECLYNISSTLIFDACLKSTKDKVKLIQDAGQAERAIILMNIEGARIPAIQSAINACQPDVTIIDECQVIKGNKSMQTQGVFELESEYRWALSATPVINNQLEWYSLLKWLRVHNSAKSRFDNYYGVWGYDAFGHYICTGYKNQPDLQELVDFVSIRFTKKSLDLPPLHEECVVLPMTDAEIVIYKAIMALKAKDKDGKLKEAFKKPKTLPNGVVIDSHATLFAYQRFFVSTIQSKVERIRQQAQSKPVIVISALVKPLKRIQQLLPQAVLYSGEQSMEERVKIQEDFMSGKISILLLSLKAAGVGLTLTRGWQVEFIEAPNTQADYEQARDRVYRISQTHDVYSYKQIADGTHDIFAWENMNAKFGWIAAYYGGNIDENV